MLAAPAKKGKGADWAGPLRGYLSRAYGEKTAEEQTESLTKLNQAREWVVSNQRGDDSSLENVKAYLRMLGAVEARFPIRETDVNMNFTWYDSFKPTKKFTHHRLENERAAVLFNYAALESYVGMSLDRTQPEGLVAACEHFRVAARYFQYLRDVYIPEKVSGPTTSDMSYDGLSMLTNLMLAQAQTLFFEKAARNAMKPSVLAKLAAGTMEMYESALAVAQKSSLVGIIDESWSNHLQYQAKCFAYSASYQYSKVLLEKAEKSGEGYGMRVAYLQNAISLGEQTIKIGMANNIPQGMIAPVKNLLDLVQKDYKKAMEENLNIYMDLVPQINTLPKVESHILAKSDIDKVDPTLVAPILPGTESSLDSNVGATLIFKDLLPSEVQIAVAMFKSRITDMLDKVKKLVSESNERIKISLSGANLPAAIEAGDSSTRGLPDDTYSKILEVVHQKGGVMGLKAALYNNAKLAEQLGGMLKDCSERLKADEQVDAKYRQVWGDRWTLPTAADASGFIKKDCARFQGYLSEAKESDRLLLEKINSEKIKTLLDDISMEKAGLDLLMPDPGQVDDDPIVENLRSNLRMSYIKLQSNMQESENKLENLKYEAEKDNIVRELYVKDMTVEAIVSDQNRLQSIIESKMSKYEEPLSEIESTIENHTSLLARVLDDTTKYMASRRENKAMRERESAISRIEHGIDEFDKINKHIEEGKAFYSNLTSKVNKLQTLVQDHCLSRDMLGKDLEQNLIRNVEDNRFVNGGPATNVPRGPNSGGYMPVTTPYQNPYAASAPMNGYGNQPVNSYGMGAPQPMPGYSVTPSYNTSVTPYAPQPAYNPSNEYMANNTMAPFNPNGPGMPPFQNAGVAPPTYSAAGYSFAQPNPTQPQQPSINPNASIPSYSSIRPSSQMPTLVNTNNNGTTSTGGSNGMSLYEELKQAQLQSDAKEQGMMAGMDADQIAMQTEVLRQQQELLEKIQDDNLKKKFANRDFSKEIEQMKALLGDSRSKEELRDYLQAADGNVEVAINYVLEGKRPNVGHVGRNDTDNDKKDEKKGFGLFGRRNKKDKKDKAPAKAAKKKENNNVEW